MSKYYVSVWMSCGMFYQGKAEGMSPLHALRNFCYDNNIKVMHAESFTVSLV